MGVVNYGGHLRSAEGVLYTLRSMNDSPTDRSDKNDIDRGKQTTCATDYPCLVYDGLAVLPFN